jgi:hypothetical protein
MQAFAPRLAFFDRPGRREAVNPARSGQRKCREARHVLRLSKAVGNDVEALTVFSV